MFFDVQFHSPSESRHRINENLIASFEGGITYGEGITRQEDAVAEVRANEARTGVVLGLEHPPVITLGRRGRAEDDLTTSKVQLATLGIELITSPRGGQATLHSPGQLVIYPCMRLSKLGISVREYVQGLEGATQNFLRSLGVETHTGCCGEPGLYTAHGKIAFFGIRVSHGIASHGLSINVSNDLDLFRLIRSCGVADEKFDRLANHGIEARPKELFFGWIPHFLKAFA